MNDPQAPHPQADAIITVTNLVKQFGRFAALRGVTASFASGRLYGILGDNGAGKTTLLRMLAGLVTPTRGTVSILGSIQPRKICREFGYMAHPSLLYDEMSGMENLRYFAQLYGLRDDQRCAEIIAAVQPDVLVKGADWAPDKIVGRDIIEARGGKVVLMPVEQGWSTTSIVAKVQALRK